MTLYERENLRIKTDELDNAVELEIKNPAALNRSFIHEIVSFSISNPEPREIVILDRNGQADYIPHDVLKMSKYSFSKGESDLYVRDITKLIYKSDILILRKPQNKLNP